MEFSHKDKCSIQNLFNKIAINYDKMNDFMSFGLQKRIKSTAVKIALKKLERDANTILDLCTGTGDIALEFKEVCPDAKILGVDFSSRMLNIARARSSDIEFLEMDITNLNSLEKKFDMCFISFGLRNLPDIDDFLENVKKVLKNGGVLAILDLGKPYPVVKPYFFIHYNFLIPLMAKVFNKDISPYQYLISSAKRYPSQDEILKKLSQHGFCCEQNINFSFGIIALQLAKYSQPGE